MVSFNELRKLNLKSVGDILPGDIFSLSDEEGYVSYFLDKMESGSDLFKAFTVFKDALAKREPVTMDDVCRIVDAYRIIDFLSQRESETITPVLYRELITVYERAIKNASSVINIFGVMVKPQSAKEELKLEKSRVLKDYYEQRLEYCRQQSEGVKVETPSEHSVSDIVSEKPEKKGFSLFGRKAKAETKAPVTAAGQSPIVAATDIPSPSGADEVQEIPGGFAVPVEEKKEDVLPVNDTAETKPEDRSLMFVPKEEDEPEDKITVADEKTDDEGSSIKVFMPVDDEEDKPVDEPVVKPVDDNPAESEVKTFVPVEDEEDEKVEAVAPVKEEVKPAPAPMFKPKEDVIHAAPIQEAVKPAPVVEKVEVVSPEPIKPVFNTAFGQKKEQEQNLRSLEVIQAKTEAGDIPCYEKSLSFTGYIPCKDMNSYALVFVKDSVYFGRMENIKGNTYDNSDESLLELTRVKANDSFVSFMTEDRSDTDTAFTEEEKKTMQIYFAFVTAVFNDGMGKTVSAGEYIRFKKNYNALVDKMLELEEDEMMLYYKALMYADRYLSYVKAYNIEVADTDRESIARSIASGDVTGFTEDYELIKEAHIVDEDAKKGIDEYIHLLEIFPDDEREEEKLPELPAIYKEQAVAATPEPEQLPPGAAMPVYDNPYNGGYGYGGYGAPPPYPQQFQQPATPVQVIVNNNFPGSTSNSGTNNQQG